MTGLLPDGLAKTRLMRLRNAAGTGHFWSVAWFAIRFRSVGYTTLTALRARKYFLKIR
jgi:hypothetical protein